MRSTPIPAHSKNSWPSQDSLSKPQNTPELFETRISSVPCTESRVTQIIKIVEKHETGRTLKKLQAAVVSQRTGATAFSSAGGIEDQKGYFLGMIG
jgi:hypothetical protein